MGIPWYFYNIYEKYNTENDLMINEHNIRKMNIDHLFLDYNSMIHPCAQQALKTVDKDTNDSDLDEYIINSCLLYTRYILNIIKPKCVYIMVDGVAPRAKINQQRERRYKSHFFKELNNEISDVYWNSNKITPGTPFMDKLTNSLYKFEKDTTDLCKVVISDSNKCGEGEHKMLSFIKNIDINDDICIYGLDADLIMLSLMNKKANKIILIRDNTFNTKLDVSKKIYTYLNIGKLKGYIYKELSGDKQGCDKENLLYDYIFLCFLLGNDFLEHIPSLMIKENGINVVMKYYNLVFEKNGEYLINIEALYNNTLENSINLDMLKDIFYHLGKSEEYFFKNVYSIYKHKNKKVYKDSFDMDEINNNNQNVYFYNKDIIKYNEYGYKERYYKFYGNINTNNACKSYIIGLFWILGYYNNHSHDNWSWYYEYEATPFASDIFLYLSKERNYLKLDTCSFLKKSIPNTSLEQLFMVLPKMSLLEILKSDKILYDKIYRIFNTNSIELDLYYPNKIYLDMIHKEYLWQSKVFLKKIDTGIMNLF